MIMLPKRARVAENRAENKSSNGPLRAQSKGFDLSILRRPARVSGQGYVGILKSVRDISVNQGGTADSDLFVLDRIKILSGAFFLCNRKVVLLTLAAA